MERQLRDDGWQCCLCNIIPAPLCRRDYHKLNMLVVCSFPQRTVVTSLHQTCKMVPWALLDTPGQQGGRHYYLLHGHKSTAMCQP